MKAEQLASAGLSTTTANRYEQLSAYSEETKPIFVASTEKYLAQSKQNGQVPTHTGTRSPAHLRKEYGSLINKAHGIHAASKALRHADISVTNNLYTDSRVRVTPGLGRLFAPKKLGKLSPRARMASEEVLESDLGQQDWITSFGSRARANS